MIELEKFEVGAEESLEVGAEESLEDSELQASSSLTQRFDPNITSQ